MANTHTDHNGKQVKATKGRNIRVTEGGWEKIRKYCFNNNLKMGAFVEASALEKISSKIKSSKK